MLIALLLLPLAAAAKLPRAVDEGFFLTIENGTLKDVQFSTGSPSFDLDLSNHGLLNMDKRAFDNVATIRSLNLANNSLTILPDFVFSNLTDLEYLSLAQNHIEEVKYLFVGLDKLKVLNISYNPTVHLGRGHLFGLTKTVDIITEGNIFRIMSSGVFENSFLKDDEEIKRLEESNVKKDPLERCEKQEGEMDTLAHGKSVAKLIQVSKKNPRLTRKGVRLMACMTDYVMSSLEILKKGVDLPAGCTEIKYDDAEKSVDLRRLGIKAFQADWYKLDSLPIATIDLSANEIVEIAKETLNDLPSDLVYVNLEKNRVTRVWSEVIENAHLKMLNLKDNQIETIDAGALKNTNLTGLFLTGNLLDDLAFLSSLPITLTELVVSGNRIESVPPGIFGNLARLVYFNLGNNKIATLRNNTFTELANLQALILTRNDIRTVEVDAFKGLKTLRILYMYRNAISSLPKAAFASLENLQDLHLAWNEFSVLTKDTFADLPDGLDYLHLDYNRIESVEVGSFSQVPRMVLSLDNNKLTSIPAGAFDLPSLQDLYLNRNQLSSIEGDAYDGLPRLKRLWLSENRITDVRKGALKNLLGLDILDISKNPYERLDNGVLYGMSLEKKSFLYIYDNNLKLLQSGVFDDV